MYPNLGPIVDFAVVDVDKQGQGQIVSCSGAYKDGSIRIVRAGIGINEFANVELAGMKGVWSFSAPPESGIDKYLVIAHVNETRVLAMSGADMNEVNLNDIDPNKQVIFCAELPQYRSIIVTADSVRVLDVGSGSSISQWQPPSGHITQCGANTSQLLIACGSTLYLFGTANGQLTAATSRSMEHEVACISLNPLGGAGEASLAAVGLWTDISLRFTASAFIRADCERVAGWRHHPTFRFVGHA